VFAAIRVPDKKAIIEALGKIAADAAAKPAGIVSGSHVIPFAGGKDSAFESAEAALAARQLISSARDSGSHLARRSFTDGADKENMGNALKRSSSGGSGGVKDGGSVEKKGAGVGPKGLEHAEFERLKKHARQGKAQGKEDPSLTYVSVLKSRFGL